MENLNLFSTAVDGLKDVNRLITLLHENENGNGENQKCTLAELALIAHETSRFVNEPSASALNTSSASLATTQLFATKWLHIKHQDN